MTKGELVRREYAVIAGFIERDGDKAYKYIQELIDYNTYKGAIFRPPLEREIDILESKEIYLCKPSCYDEDDPSDCEILFDIYDLCRYLMLDVKPEKYAKFKNSLTKEFYDDVIEKVQNKPAYIELRKK